MNKKCLKIGHLFLLVALLILAAGCATVSTSGDYTLDSGQTLQGNLVITSGNGTLEEDSLVTGDVLMTSGDLQVDGEINGNIVLFSGAVSLGPEAIIHGDIWGTSGDVQRADGAEVRGQILTSQSIFRFGDGFFASLFGLICGLPLLLIGGLIVLVIVLRRGRDAKSSPVPAAQPQASVTFEDSSLKLKKLREMLDNGLITEDDYEAKKTEILANL